MTRPETIRLDPSAVRRAFDAHGVRYVALKNWTIEHHVDMWNKAARAEASGTLADFEAIYWPLRKFWRVFRPGQPPPPRKVFGILRKVDPAVRALRLPGLASANPPRVEEIWRALVTASAIKMKANGPSVVAVSKFLHFWNPQLFVIVDAEIMRDLVLSHAWLRRDIEAVRKELRARAPRVAKHRWFNSELGTYLAVLVWAARVMEAHPRLMPAFWAHLERDARKRGVRVPRSARRAQAAAVEWLLLGLVELPPRGVTVTGPARKVA